MPPESRCDGALAIAVGIESGFEELLCEDARLRQPVHPFLDFDGDVAVAVDEVV